MPKKQKLGNTRHDKWWHLAKEQGYRSRAAFKLIQLNKKYDFLSKAKSCLDLCAAPGGWMQVAEKFMPAGSLIIGIDLLPIKPVRNCIAFQEDITSQRCRNLIRKELKAKNLSGIDVIIHDGAPNVGGNSWLKDAYGQIELVLFSLKLAVDFLRPGSYFVTKVFRSQDYNALLWVLQKFFKKIEVTKPVASRNTSAEIYVIGEGFLAPKNFDPRLLDPAHLFKHIEDSTAKKEVDVLHGKNKQKRHRDGYDDDVGVVVYKERPAFEFIDANNEEALAMLGACNKFTWGKDEKSQQYRALPATTEEIITLCADLKVLSRTDFANLMKWRLKLRRSLDKEKKLEKKQGVADAEKPLVPEIDEDEKLTAEVEELARKKAIAERNKKKKQRELKAKERRRVALGMVTPDNLQDTPEDQGLFSLSLAKSDGDLQTLLQDNGVDSINVDDEEAGEPFVGKHGEYAEKAEELERRLAERKKEKAASAEDGEDEEEENLERMRELEEAMGFMYEQYKERRNIRTKKEKARLERLGLTGEEEQDEAVAAAAASKAEKKDSDDDSDDSDDDDEEEEDEDAFDSETELSGTEDGEDGATPAKRTKRNPLLVTMGAGARASASEKAERWFSRDLFSDVNGAADEKAAEAGPVSRKRRMEEPAEVESDDDDEEEAEEEEEEAKGEEKEADEDEDDDEEDLTGAKPSRKQKEKDGFEEVPVDLDISDDDDAKAEIMALGQLMIRKKTRNALIDSAYNRFAFNDYGGEDVPEWFAEDEDRHNKKQLPITKEEADMYKMQLKAIDARPIKKIAEAKARKKFKTAKRWEKMKAQAQTIVDNSTLSEKDKSRQIEKLYSKKDGKKKKVERTYVVAKKGGGQSQAMAKKGAKGPVKVVDPRMKKDKRALKASEKKKGKGGNKRRRKA